MSKKFLLLSFFCASFSAQVFGMKQQQKPITLEEKKKEDQRQEKFNGIHQPGTQKTEGSEN